MSEWRKERAHQYHVVRKLNLRNQLKVKSRSNKNQLINDNILKLFTSPPLFLAICFVTCLSRDAGELT